MGCILKGGGGLYNRVTVGAVVLAAGSGSRMGHRPKCLLELGGVPLIRRLLIALSGAGVDEVVVVLGHHAEVIGPVVETFPVTVVRNPSPDEGIESSQRLGLAALSPKLDAVVMALADQPLINAQDVMDLIGAYKKRPEGMQVVVPHHANERGNPVVLDASVRDAILARPVIAESQEVFAARQWQAEHRQAVHAWATENRRYRVDLDTEADIERFERETGHRLKWPPSMVQAETPS